MQESVLQPYGMWVWNWNKYINKINKNIININEYVIKEERIFLSLKDLQNLISIYVSINKNKYKKLN